MVKAKDKDIKPIKSSISDDFGDDKYLAHAHVFTHEIKDYIAKTFKKEISDLDVLNFALFICNEIVTAKKWENQKKITENITEIINDESRLNEYIFTHLATIKAWNETVAELGNKYESKDDISEKEFDELMSANTGKYQYKAWNDEKIILDAYGLEYETTDDNNGGA